MTQPHSQGEQMIKRRHKTFREQLIDKAMTSCRNFNGIQHDCCSAGVNYDSLREGDRYALPCLPNFVNLSKRDPALCEKFAVMTEVEAIKEADETVAQSERTMHAMRTAHENAERAGLRRGNGGVGSMPCPVAACNGTLHYSVASYNGHMHAKCDTGTCVSWME